MPRVPYVFPPPGASEIADNIRKRRKDGELIDLDGMMLNAPAIAHGYSSLLKAIRVENSLPDDIRELMILRVAVLNSAVNEWIAHEPLARGAGMTTEQLAIVRDVSNVPGSFEAVVKTLSPLQASALVFADYMTRNIKVPVEIFERFRAGLKNDQQVVEATSTVAAYNMVSRFLVALDVSDKADEEVPYPQ